MKLISKTHDYYDSVFRNYSSEDTNVFVRNKDSIYVPKSGLTRFSLSHVFCKQVSYSFDIGIIGFCGILYPFIKVMVNNPEKSIYNDIHFAYTKEDMEKIIDGYKTSNLKQHCRNGIIYSNYYGFYGTIDNWLGGGLIKKYSCEDFDVNKSEFLKSIFTDHKVAYFSMDINDSNGEIELYPVLADYKFFKVFDVFQAYQAIETYLCNILVKPDDPYIAPIPDAIKAQSKGFNKFSFRKEKAGKS